MTNAVVEAFMLVTADGAPYGSVRHRAIDGAPDGVRAGMTPDGTRVLIVSVSDDALRTDDRASTGVWLLGSPELGDRPLHILECRDPSLDGVFAQLAAELVEDLRGIEIGHRSRVLRHRLQEWRQLFGPNRREIGMSREDQVGLWGELKVLGRRVLAGAHDAVGSWEAGLGSPGPDFRWSGVSMEVKTTTALEGFELRIHGLAQLEPPPSGATLLIAGVRAVAEPDGVSIVDLVTELLDKIPRGEFLRRLAVRGYRHDPASDIEWLRLSLDSISVWRIDESTPRLSPGQLPPAWRPAITEVEYTLDATALGKPLDEEDSLWR